MAEADEIARRKELAKSMAMARTKPNNRQRLSDKKSEGDSGLNMTARKGNMLGLTGEEGNGTQISASTASVLIMAILFGIVMLHFFGTKVLLKPVMRAAAETVTPEAA